MTWLLRWTIAAAVASAACSISTTDEGLCESPETSNAKLDGDWSSPSGEFVSDARPSYATASAMNMHIDREHGLVTVRYARDTKRVEETWNIESSDRLSIQRFEFLRRARASCGFASFQLKLKLVDSTLDGVSDTTGYGDGTATLRNDGANLDFLGGAHVRVLRRGL